MECVAVRWKALTGEVWWLIDWSQSNSDDWLIQSERGREGSRRLAWRPLGGARRSVPYPRDKVCNPELRERIWRHRSLQRLFLSHQWSIIACSRFWLFHHECTVIIYIINLTSSRHYAVLLGGRITDCCPSVRLSVSLSRTGQTWKTKVLYWLYPPNHPSITYCITCCGCCCCCMVLGRPDLSCATPSAPLARG